jgi:catechol 2,3-dioxygenase-like lactoylglutathione lyase family enzyme
MPVLALVTLVVRDYDEAIAFYRDKLGFAVAEDTPQGAKRWVVLQPASGAGARLLLARAANEYQMTRVGDQTGGRVFLFLHTDDFVRDFNVYVARGVKVARLPRDESYGTVAVIEDLYGNLIDLIGPSGAADT